MRRPGQTSHALSTTPLTLRRSLALGALALAACGGTPDPRSRLGEEAPAVARAESSLTRRQPWLTILCRFADARDITPHPPSWFATLMGSTYPGMDHYFREISYGNVVLTGSRVVGWYNLPQPRSYYLGPDGNGDAERLGRDCAAVADADVFFPDYSGINFMFNQDVNGYFIGGSWPLNIDGRSQLYGKTWTTPAGYEDQRYLARKMAEAFGVAPGAGGGSWNLYGTCSPRLATYGCPAVHMAAPFKDQFGWTRTYEHPLGTATVTLEQQASPTAPVGVFYMAKIPIRGTAEYYAVEARRPAGYDDHIVAPAVIIYRVNPAVSPLQAVVMDADGNGDPNDAGAMWLPSETFSDAAAGIAVRVDSMTATGFVVTITAPPAQFTHADFNGDGKVDQLVTTNAGSFWEFSNGDGTFTTRATRRDLPLGKVAYTPGDFNGDGNADVVITTASGSYWYLSNGDGTFATPYTRTDLPLGSVAFTPGDFNSDRSTDLVITTAAGSAWHFANGNGSFAVLASRTDLPLGGVAYTPGDFDGDGKTDLVITTPSGSYWYLSRGDGTFATPYSRTDLPLEREASCAGEGARRPRARATRGPDSDRRLDS